MSETHPIAGPTTASPTREPTWGLPDAFLGWLGCWVFAQLAGAFVFAMGGYKTSDQIEGAPLAWTFGAAIFIWIAFLAVAIGISVTKGRGPVADYHLALKPWDVPLGAMCGVIAQFILVPIIAFPILKLTGTDADDLARPAQELADKAHGAGGAFLMLLVVGVIAPIAEELFFRGLLFGAMEKRWNQWWALGLSSAFFAFTHLQPLQFLPLMAAGAVFGGLVVRTGRLGPAMVAHMAFNISTVVVLLWLS